MKQDYIEINGKKYTHLLKEDVLTSLNTIKHNVLVAPSKLEDFLKKSEILQEEDDSYISIDGKILYKEYKFNTVPLKFNKKFRWDNWREHFVTLGQNLQLTMMKTKFNSYNISIKVSGPKKSDVRIIIEFNDYLLDDANELIKTMFQEKIPEFKE